MYYSTMQVCSTCVCIQAKGLWLRASGDLTEGVFYSTARKGHSGPFLHIHVFFVSLASQLAVSSFP